MSTKGEMRVPKQTFLQYDCFGAYHQNIHTGEKENFWLFFHCHQWTFTRFGGWKVDFFPISTGFFCINSSLQKYTSTGSKYLYEWPLWVMEQFLDTLLVVLEGCPVTFHYSIPVSEISWGSGLIWAYNNYHWPSLTLRYFKKIDFRIKSQ